ncbi:MAG TPA: penicillin acylase family protein [Arenimonas sp.]|uniref:penicillin acylase family protein n=1 Tax=Arenimonas sp. TaxID=1872635 RepID=UPI002B5F0060|nr:penicillin acylase family protein [Arenimonas sp.]HMB57269.1 penicillin acylase family protein [Arenimonas sp.]
MTRLPRLLLRLILVLLLLVILALATGWWAMRGSLATLDGELSLPGLSAPVQVERDALGVVTIHAANQVDAARALGYVHGQERFFEMDLLRRSAAGELSELFGKIAIEKDKTARVHRLRARIMENMTAVAGDKMPVLQAYTDGVNAGLDSLRVRPWAYLLLGSKPRPWQPADTALAGYAMFFDLQDEANSRELALWKMKQVVPDALYQLIAADGSEWDAPLFGAARGNVALPMPDVLDLRKLPMPDKDSGTVDSEPGAPGSNNFAVAGALTKDGRAIVADDMHLGLRAPNIWFRARLLYPDARAPDGKVDVGGFTLPGIPAVIVGSNTHVAWGFTNSYGDWLDFYRVDWLDAGKTRYRVPEGEQKLRVTHETILVKGEADVDFIVRETRWGPIVKDQNDGSALALRWTAQLPGSLNLDLADLARAGGLDAGLAVADVAGIPAQNLVIGDSSGRIAWRLTAKMPLRSGNCNAKEPLTVAAPCRWSGWLAATENPSLIDPANGRLWTANARVVDGDALRLIGDNGYANGARARQIRDDLLAKDRFDERDLLAIQLDDRALFLQRWWTLLRAHALASNDPAWKEIEAATRRWDGRAAPDSVSYRVVRAWRLAVIDRIKKGLMAPAMAELGKDFVMPDLPQIEGVAWELVSLRPEHLLPRKFSSWDALLLDAARETTTDLDRQGPLAQRTWGERNTAHICHPLARALPGFAKSLLCMPAEALAGDVNMPRVVGPEFGASERMVVSPGHEADGIIHMPGGQSGNPLSPFWGAGHEAWVRGEPTPFLPGKTTHTMRLSPGDK